MRQVHVLQYEYEYKKLMLARDNMLNNDKDSN